jgi:UDPglucose--hexose-1-phosphate uridylyltransferase
VIHAIQKRVKELYEIKEIKYVQVFRNYGKESGASIRHSHLQIVGLDFIPEKIDEIKNKLKKCSCKICRKYKEQVLIYEGSFFRVLAVDGRFPYEVEIHPKEHKGFLKLNNEEIKELSKLIILIIKRIKEYFNAYNVLFFIEPKNNNDFHFFIRIIPRINKFGGLEFSTNIFVNAISKEKAFEFYKDIFNF